VCIYMYVCMCVYVCVCVGVGMIAHQRIEEILVGIKGEGGGVVAGY